MAKFQFKHRTLRIRNSSPRVFFTCHPADFDNCFEKICEDIFRTHDCTVVYTEDMNQQLLWEDRRTDFERINLLVVPVTCRLLTTPNRAMDDDIPYALAKRIPILPLLMDPAATAFYTQKFDQLQYLNVFSSDLSEISYEEKLKKYLDSVLVSEELANRIRSAFDAYIFLSYRKKDRHYANELMRLIHRNPECRDIAVWFDEFLTPGESFRDNIDKILNNSKLFALLVTPNLLEKPDGKPNFVMGEEYPAAKAAGLTIIPAEMVDTDRHTLEEAFLDLPECVDPRDDACFRERLLEAASRLAIQSNDTPEHNFLIGLAYLEGIDVEVDRARGLNLISRAAEDGLPEAMEKISQMYDTGDGITLSYGAALYWKKALMEHYEQVCGPDDPKTLHALNELSLAYQKDGDYQNHLRFAEQVYRRELAAKGKIDHGLLILANNVAMAHYDLGNYQAAFEMLETICENARSLYFEADPIVLTFKHNLAILYGQQGLYQKALDIFEEIYRLELVTLGESHEHTLSTQSGMAEMYRKLGNHIKAREIYEEVYQTECSIFGKEHPNTLRTQHLLAATYQTAQDYQTACRLQEECYHLRCKALGAEHPDTLDTLSFWATSCRELDDFAQDLTMREKAYEALCRILGKEHPKTLTALHNLALACCNMSQDDRAVQLGEEVYALRCKVLGEKHPSTLISLTNLADSYWYLGQLQTALTLFKKSYQAHTEVVGPFHKHTRHTFRLMKQLEKELQDGQNS